MSYHYNCRLAASLVAWCQDLNRLLDHSLAVRVKGRSCLVEYDYLGVSDQGSCYRNTLFLASRKIQAFFSDVGQKLLGESFLIAEKFHASGSFGCVLNLLIAEFFRPIDDVIFDCAWKHGGILIDQSYLFPEVNRVDIFLLMLTIADGTTFLNSVEILD